MKWNFHSKFECYKLNIRFLIFHFEFNGFWLRFHFAYYPDIVRSNGYRIQLWSDLFIFKIIKFEKVPLGSVLVEWGQNFLDFWVWSWEYFIQMHCISHIWAKKNLSKILFVNNKIQNSGLIDELWISDRLQNSQKRFYSTVTKLFQFVGQIFIQLRNRINHVFWMCNVHWYRESVRILKRFSI